MNHKTNSSMRLFFTIWSGQAVSLFGSQLVQFALIWWLTKTTGSATVLAVASLVGLLPQVVLGPFIGVLVDRWNRRLIMLVADSAVAVATIALVLLFWLDLTEIWHVYMILGVRALAGTFHFPAMLASTTLMVPEQHLTRIQGANQTLQGALSIVSAPLGALLLEMLPMQGVLLIDVVTAMVAIVPLLFIQIPQPDRQVNYQSGSAMGSFWMEMREGFDYLRGWRSLVMLTALAMIIKILLNPAFALIPILVTKHFGGRALELGYMEAAGGVGIVLGGVILSAWGGFKRRVISILVGLIGLGIGFAVMGLAPASFFTLGLLGIVMGGLAIPMIDGPLMAMMQANIEPEKQGRVLMLFGSVISSTVPIGLLIAGPVADAVGVRTWFLATAVVTLVMGAVGFLFPDALDLDRKPTVNQTAVELAATAAGVD